MLSTHFKLQQRDIQCPAHVRDCGRSACQAWGGGARGWLNRVHHPGRQCSRQQYHVKAVHAIIYSSDATINQCGAGWGGFQGAGSWTLKIGGGGTLGSKGGGVKTFLECNHVLLQFRSILCTVISFCKL